MSNTCVICGDGEAESPLHRNPCGRHYVCNDDLQGFFRTAIKDESLYPPDCCRVPFLLMDYEEVLPYDLLFEYQSKEQGEYAVQKKFRIYCANPSCAKFLRPDSHITDPESNITYAICDEDTCGKTSCVKCRTILVSGTAGHVCEVPEVDKQFIDTAKKERYQQCYACGETIELTEACNHISCGCGNDFCYVCGKPWSGLHGCPQYGPAEYDEEGYNQDGYHRDTGLNRDGLTRLQFSRQGREEEENEEDEEEEEEGFQLPPWVAPEFREVFNVLSPEDQIEALELHRIEMGIFDQEEPDGEEHDDEGDGEGEDGEEAEVGQEVEVDVEIPVIHRAEGPEEGEEEETGQPDIHEASSFDLPSPNSPISASEYPLPLSRPESSALSHHGVIEDDNFSGPSSPSAPESSGPDTDPDIVPMDIGQEGTKIPTQAPYVWTDEEL